MINATNKKYKTMKTQEQINIALSLLFDRTCWVSPDGRVKRNYNLTSVPFVAIDNGKLTLSLEFVATSDKRNIAKQGEIKESVDAILARWGCTDGVNVIPVIHNEKAVLFEQDGNKCVVVFANGLAYYVHIMGLGGMNTWYSIECQDDIIKHFPLRNDSEGTYEDWAKDSVVLGEKCYTDKEVKNEEEVTLALVVLKGHNAVILVKGGMIASCHMADDITVRDRYDSIKCKRDAFLAFPINGRITTTWSEGRKTLEVISEKNFAE